MVAVELSSPQRHKRRNYNLFAKRTVSDETIQAAKPDRDVVYQARLKSSKEDDQSRHQNQTESGPSTPRASTSSTSARNSPRFGEAYLTPTRLQLDSGGKKRMKSDQTSTTSRSNDQISNRMIPLQRAKIRQSSLGLDGLSKLSNKRLPGQHNSKSFWSSDRRTNSMEAQQRRQSETLDTQSEAIRRASIFGAKPVAPSYHPDAPAELKVKSPSNAVLLPFLSIPANQKGLEDRDTSPLSPLDFHAESVLQSTTIKHQRPNIKVRIITWNQGASVPKGDLEVLLGKVGEYIAPQECWDESSDEENEKKDAKSKHRGMGVAGQEKTSRKDRIPPLPHDDAHPYHIVIVAGQECPWGDGKRIATGVGLAGELGDLSRSKSRAAKEKEKRDAHKRDEEGKTPDEKMISTVDDGEYPFAEPIANRSIPSTPAPIASVPSTPGGASIGGAWGIGGKGWSDMCEDWLCRGPLAQATATKGLAQASKAVNASPMILSPVDTPENSVTPAESRSTTPIPGLGLRQDTYAAMSPQGQASISTASEVRKDSSPNKVIAKDHHYSQPSSKKNTNLAVPNIGRSISFASRSKDKLEIPYSNTAENGEGELSSSPVNRPLSPIKQAIDVNVRMPAHLNRQQSVPGKGHHRLGLHIPGLSASHHVTVQSDGTPLSLGAYELVAKERCYMMYMAVYVWRGCLDRVTKTSQGHVKSGLLAGRVGNKGAVGISLKFGVTRLLFVNAHLAAHEGKVAERIANVEKIKSELKVDTFLPPEDPRNKADDVTEAFDYAFWFGDLNFRVDISRQHADWLLMKKQYQDALAFDQLTKVRKEQPNVFKNFNEAEITFPPTFKYDVLKTIKHKREEKARKLTSSSIISKQQNSSQNDGLSLSNSQKDLKLVESSSLTDMSSTSLSRFQNAALVRERKEEGLDEDAGSVSSSNWGSSAVSTSAGHYSDRDDLGTNLASSGKRDSQLTPLNSIVSNNTAAAEGHALHGKAIKIKKRILDAVHAIGNHSPRREKEDHVPHILKAGGLLKSQHHSRRNSNELKIPSATLTNNFDYGNETELTPPKAPFKHHLRTESSSSLNELTRDLDHGQNGQLSRRRSSLSEMSPTSPNRKQQQQSQNNDNEKLQPSSSLSAMMEEYEKQPYDTSAKQRVPSWCDRVLWKSNVEVILPEGGMANNARNTEGSTTFHNRMTSAFSNAFSNDRRRLRLPEKRQSISFVSEQMSKQRQSRSIDLDLSNETDNFKESNPTNRAISPRRHWYHRKNGEEALRRSATFDHQRSPSLSSKFPGRSIDSDTDRKKFTSSSDLPLRGERSSSSQGIPILVIPRRKSGNSHEAFGEKHSSSNSSPRSFTPDQISAKSAGSTTRDNLSTDRQAIHFTDDHQSPIMQNVPLSDPSLSNNNDNQSNLINGGEQSTNRKSSWWNGFVGGPLSSFLTPLGTANNAFNNNNTSNNRQILPSVRNNGEDIQSSEELIGPRKGQIHCLLYKSLDDREMRLLEGRSDHRPVIWVGSIGV